MNLPSIYFKGRPSLHWATTNTGRCLSSRRCLATNWIKESVWLNAVSPQVNIDKEETFFAQRCAHLHKSILKANWGDTFALVQNAPFWEAEFEKLHGKVRSVPTILSNPELARSWVALSTLLDFFFVCEDLTDHVNELVEMLDRTHSRFGGATQEVSNLDEHLKTLLSRREILASRCASYSEKLDESVGKSIRLLRRRNRFHWPQERQAFY